MRSAMRFACAVALCFVLAGGVNARTLQQKQKPVACPGAPPDVDYNTWPSDCLDNPLGFACKGDCALGYTGSPTAVCQKKGWAANGACKPATCSNTLPDIANATWEACVDSPVGTVCTAKCDGYFTESGPINSTCTGVLKGATWSTPSGYCGIINSQATLTIEAAVAGGVCSDAATAAVKQSVEGFMSTQSVSELNIHVTCYNADGTNGGSARRLQEDASLNVRYVVLVVYIGGEAAAQTLVDTAQTDLAQIGDLIASVASATGGAVTIQQEGVTGDVSGGGNPVLNPEQEAKVSLLRSGPAPNIQSNTSFYLTAVYTGSAGVAVGGVTISGPTISPSDAVTCTPLNAAPLTDGAGIASWSCVTGPTGTNVTISVTAPHPSGDTVSDSVDFTIGTDCVGSFSPFGSCSNVCGQGEYSRTFNVTTPADNGGRACLFENGFIQSDNCTGPITCGECSSCGVTACVDLAAGTDCSQQGKCYNGICQPGAKIFDVKSISPLGIPANNTEWIWLRYTTTSPNAALAQFVNLTDEAGRTTVPLGMTASVTNAVSTEAPEDPRSPGSPLTSALLMINPQGFTPPKVPVAEPLDKIEAALYYVNNTPDHPAGMFNGMKFKDLVDANFTMSFSWYRGSFQNMTVGSAPIFRFTITNPAQVPTPRGVQFVWEPAYNLVAGAVPTNTWRNEVVNFNQGKLSVWMGSYATALYGSPGIDCYQPLSWWMTSTSKCSNKFHPWFSANSATLFGTTDLFRDGVISDIRVQALNPRTLAYANNFKISTSNGYSFTYVFTN